MTIEETVEKAKQGGWKDEKRGITGLDEMLLDKSWWQALGKSSGWGNLVCVDCGKLERQSAYNCRGMTEAWQFYWHDFISHLATGKSIEEFFERLS